jgi:hypothetical protein
MIAIAYLTGCAAPLVLGAIKQQAGLPLGIAMLPLALAPGVAAAVVAARRKTPGFAAGSLPVQDAGGLAP